MKKPLGTFIIIKCNQISQGIGFKYNAYLFFFIFGLFVAYYRKIVIIYRCLDMKNKVQAL